jgi:pimeloyl-ACP methyl ester carboxylesterase
VIKKVLIYNNSAINYYCFGHGPQAVFCFHGYGQDAATFHFLDKYMGDRYSFLSIDLPFHGDTVWKDGLCFTPDDLLQIVEKIMQQEKVTSDKCTLMAFSLGGRMLLQLYQSAPQKFNRLLLLAPDGLKVNFWYWLATQTWAGNKLFHLTMKKPGWFLGLLRAFNKLGMINSSIFKFVKYYIHDKDVRELLYNRWTLLRKIKPDLQKVKSFIQQNQTPVAIVYGSHDRIILSSVGKRFQQGIENYCSIEIIESGHQVLHEKHVADIIKYLS